AAEPRPAAVTPAAAAAGPDAAATPPAETDALAALDMAVIDAAVVGAIDSDVPSRTLAPGVSPSSISGLDALRRAGPAAASASAGTQIAMAQVTGSNVNLRSGPSTGNPVEGQAREGERVEWLDEPEPGWARIRHPRYEGDLYMSSSYLSRMTN
ncbi:SH3 domain-containing protein, partial [Mangrovicoccus algicola]